MLVTKITNRKQPPVPVVYSPPVSTISPQPAALFNEIRRRENIIAALVKDFKHKVGDYLEPGNQQDFDKWGKCTVLVICDQYIHLGRDFEWPKNDNPMLITASSESGEIFFATTNYFK